MDYYHCREHIHKHVPLLATAYLSHALASPFTEGYPLGNRGLTRCLHIHQFFGYGQFTYPIFKKPEFAKAKLHAFNWRLEERARVTIA